MINVYSSPTKKKLFHNFIKKFPKKLDFDHLIFAYVKLQVHLQQWGWKVWELSLRWLQWLPEPLYYTGWVYQDLHQYRYYRITKLVQVKPRKLLSLFIRSLSIKEKIYISDMHTITTSYILTANMAVNNLYCIGRKMEPNWIHCLSCLVGIPSILNTFLNSCLLELYLQPPGNQGPEIMNCR